MTTLEPMAVLVTGGTGSVGSRVTAQLRQQGVRARPACRSIEPAFDWAQPITWPATLADADALFLLLPEDRHLDPDFLTAALASGVGRVVLLSDRGLNLMPVERLQHAEELVRQLRVPWTILRPDWFAQDFETFFRQPILDGLLHVPLGDMRQGFVDADDIAAVAVAVLVGDGHAGATYELTGPEALTFREALDVIGLATGRTVDFDGTAEGYLRHAADTGLNADLAEQQITSWARVHAAGDVVPSGVVERVTGRPARRFTDYVDAAVRRGVWA